MTHRCINCGKEIPDYYWRKWYDYCDKCKTALKKARDVRKLNVFFKDRKLK